MPRSYARGVQPKTLDHVAFWVADREPIVEFATRHLGMHVIDRQDAFTLVGSNARRGKLTLFDADGPRERGAIKHVALRVSDLEEARASLPDGAGDELEVGEGIRVRRVARGGSQRLGQAAAQPCRRARRLGRRAYV